MCQHLGGAGQRSPDPLPPRASQSGGETRPVTSASLRAVMGQFGQGGGTCLGALQWLTTGRPSLDRTGRQLRASGQWLPPGTLLASSTASLWLTVPCEASCDKDKQEERGRGFLLACLCLIWEGKPSLGVATLCISPPRLGQGTSPCLV